MHDKKQVVSEEPQKKTGEALKKRRYTEKRTSKKEQMGPARNTEKTN
jgi:hypothetical protein